MISSKPTFYFNPVRQRRPTERAFNSHYRPSHQ